MEVITFKEIVNRTFIDGMMIGALIVSAIWIAGMSMRKPIKKRPVISVTVPKKPIDWQKWGGEMPGLHNEVQK